jgi:hypothetical protein
VLLLLLLLLLQIQITELGRHQLIALARTQ